jgi:hypothetical protein
MLEVPIVLSKGSMIVDTGRGFRDPGNSYLIAHDIVDHPLVPHEDLVIDELMAVGGAWARSGRSVDKLERLVYFIKTNTTDPCPVRYEGRRDRALTDAIRPVVERVVGDVGLAWEMSGWIGEGHRRFVERFPDLEVAERLHGNVVRECVRFTRTYWGKEGVRGVLEIRGSEVCLR